MMHFQIGAALLKPVRERRTFTVTLSDEDVAHASALATTEASVRPALEGPAVWRLVQHLAATGYELDQDAKPVFEFPSTS